MLTGFQAWLAERSANKNVARQAAPRRLKPYTLGASSGSLRIAGWPVGGSQFIVEHDPSFDGIEVRGLGIGKTIVSENSWDDLAVGIGRFSGTVRLTNMTVIGGLGKIATLAAGGENKSKDLVPSFRLGLDHIELRAALPGADGKRTTWGLSGYNVDVVATDCIFDFTFSTEHSAYLRGPSKYGWLLERCKFIGSGAEGWKTRSDSTETAYAGKDVWLVVRDCEFKNWGQPQSWRGGGAGIVVQGGATNILIERCVFRGGAPNAQFQANERSHCVMVSSEAVSYDIETGRQDQGYGNGWIIIRDNAMYGHSDFPWHNELVDIYQNSGPQWSCKGVLIKNNGLFGQGVIVSVSGVPSGKVKIAGNNTPAIKAYCQSIGIDTTHEAGVHYGGKLQPVSKGFSW